LALHKVASRKLLAFKERDYKAMQQGFVLWYRYRMSIRLREERVAFDTITEDHALLEREVRALRGESNHAHAQQTLSRYAEGFRGLTKLFAEAHVKRQSGSLSFWKSTIHSKAGDGGSTRRSEAGGVASQATAPSAGPQLSDMNLVRRQWEEEKMMYEEERRHYESTVRGLRQELALAESELTRLSASLPLHRGPPAKSRGDNEEEWLLKEVSRLQEEVGEYRASQGTDKEQLQASSRALEASAKAQEHAMMSLLASHADELKRVQGGLRENKHRAGLAMLERTLRGLSGQRADSKSILGEWKVNTLSNKSLSASRTLQEKERLANHTRESLLVKLDESGRELSQLRQDLEQSKMESHVQRVSSEGKIKRLEGDLQRQSQEMEKQRQRTESALASRASRSLDEAQRDDDVAHQLTQLQAERDLMVTSKAALEQELESNKQVHMEEWHRLNNLAEELRRQLGELTEAIQEERSRRHQAESQLKNYKVGAGGRALSDENFALEAENRELAGALEQAEEELLELREDQQSLALELPKAMEDIARLQREKEQGLHAQRDSERELELARRSATALGNEIHDMQAESVSYNQVTAERDFLNKSQERLKRQLVEVKESKEREVGQHREDKALLHKALTELQRQFDLVSADKEDALLNTNGDTAFLRNENADLKQKLNNTQRQLAQASTGSSPSSRERVEMDRLKTAVEQAAREREEARRERDQMQRQLSRLADRQDEPMSPEKSREQSQLVAELSKLHDENAQLRQAASSRQNEGDAELLEDFATLQKELFALKRSRQPNQREVESLRHRISDLEQELKPNGPLLQQVLEERDAALREVTRLVDSMEAMQRSGKASSAGPQRNAQPQGGGDAAKQLDVLTKYVMKLEADLDAARAVGPH